MKKWITLLINSMFVGRIKGVAYFSYTPTLQKSKGSFMRLRWSRGSVLASSTQVRGFKPGRSRRIFQGEKIFSTPSFGGEVKPSVPCRRYTACKRFLNATWKSGNSGKIHRSFLAHIVPPLVTTISGETTSGESWNV